MLYERYVDMSTLAAIMQVQDMVDLLAVKDPTKRWLEIGLHENAEFSVVA